MSPHTPGPWEWWTSNSWRRLRHSDRGVSTNVILPVVCPDGHPDLEVNAADAALIERAWQIPEMETEITHLRKLVYVPGLWRCPKCEFQLVQSNLNAADGSVTARNQAGDKCPNCNGPLWRVTERDAGNRLCDRVQTEIEINRDLLAALKAIVSEIRAYQSPECDDEGAPGAAELKLADAAIAKAEGHP